ncbi:MAG: SDR family oxidoreductase [Nitrososphaerota archaeon]|nr:SDR family oxidoreductase [Nitrososphaerota archaeon]MDG6922334.1 SDR family oxidoreductase [Nitrososphaerota archaeon]
MSSSFVEGKTCVVTGANSGIGYVTARELARMGAKIILVCRNQSKCEVARDSIKKATGNESVESEIADLASFGSVRKLAQRLQQSYEKIHILVNNAGLIIGKRMLTEDGLETTFQVNYASHFLLTYLLLNTMKESAPSRIINVSSAAHFSGYMDFDDLQKEKSYSAMRSYCQSKLAQVLFTYELADRLNGTSVTVNCVHPGAVRTNWGDEAGALGIGIRIARPFMLSPEKGAQTTVYAAISPDLDEISGKYFAKRKEARTSKESYDVDERKKLWDISLKLCRLE